MPYVGPYAATKGTRWLALTKSGALDCTRRKNIRANAVAPGAIKTDIITQQIALGQYDEPTVTARCIRCARMWCLTKSRKALLWLLSDKASSVTGHVLSIDGGFSGQVGHVRLFTMPPNKAFRDGRASLRSDQRRNFASIRILEVADAKR